jgi:hypothetical protein
MTRLSERLHKLQDETRDLDDAALETALDEARQELETFRLATRFTKEEMVAFADRWASETAKATEHRLNLPGFVSRQVDKTADAASGVITNYVLSSDAFRKWLGGRLAQVPDGLHGLVDMAVAERDAELDRLSRSVRELAAEQQRRQAEADRVEAEAALARIGQELDA